MFTWKKLLPLALSSTLVLSISTATLAAGSDFSMFFPRPWYAEAEFFMQENQPISPELQAAIREAYPDKENLQASQIDTLIRLPMLKIMAHKADQGGAPVYAYLFDFDNAFHGAEIPLVFRNTNLPLAELVSQAWVSFARTGTPEMDGLSEWEPYTRESGATLLLDTVPELVHHHDQRLLELLAPDYEY